MKKIGLFICLLIVCNTAFCQPDSLLPKNQIKISPLRIIDIINPGFEASYERLYSKNLSTQLSLAYMTDPFHFTSFESEHGFRISLEEKYFIKSKKKHRNYLSAEAVFYHLNFDKETQGIKRNSLDSTHFDDYSGIASFEKNTAIFNVKYGVQTYLSQHFLLDIYTGVGLRYYKVKGLTATDFDVVEPIGKNFLDELYSNSSQPGQHYGISIPFNIKIGYTF